MAHDVVFSLSSVLKRIDKGFYIHKRVDGFFLEFVECMNPDINVTVYFTHWVLPQRCLLCFLLDPLNLSLLRAKVRIVLDRFQLKRLSVVVYFSKLLPTQWPVLPSYNQP